MLEFYSNKVWRNIEFKASAVHLHHLPPVTSPAASCAWWRSGVCRAGEGRPPGRLGVATQRPAWKPLGQPWCLCLPVQSGHLITTIHLSQSFLPARAPAAASHVTIEPGLDGCCSESRESPIWTTGETEEAGGGQRGGQSRCVLLKAKDGLNQSHSPPGCIGFHFLEKEWKKKLIGNRWILAKCWIVAHLFQTDEAVNGHWLESFHTTLLCHVLIWILTMACNRVHLLK